MKPQYLGNKEFIGFTKKENGRFINEDYEAWDLVPRNVLRGQRR